jgi:hydrogenase maturation protease
VNAVATDGAGPHPRIVVVGLGNLLLADDGIGILVARALEERLRGTEVRVAETSWGGMRFLDLLAGFDKAVIIDAIQWQHGPAGSIYRLSPAEAIPTVRAVSYHDMSLGTALKLGAALGMHLPGEVVFFAVEVEDTRTFRESCAPAAMAAVPEVVRRIEAQLREWEVLSVGEGGRGVSAATACTAPSSRHPSRC